MPLALRAVRSPAYPMMPYSDSSARIPASAELLADDGEDEVGVGLGDVEDLLDRRAQPVAEHPAAADRDLALHRLKARAGRVIPGIEEARQPRAPVGLEDREQHHQRRADARREAELAHRQARRDQHRPDRRADHQVGAEVGLQSRSAAPPPPRPRSPGRSASVSSGRSSAGWRSPPQMCSTSAIFMISLGWNWSGPKPSQRCAPLTRTPTPGTLTITSITKLAISSAPV